MVLQIILRQLQGKYLAKKKDLYFAYVALRKAFGPVSGDIIRLALRKLGIEEWLVRTVQ